MKRIAIDILCAGAIAATATPAMAAVNLLADGNFSNGLTGWTNTGTSVITTTAAGNPKTDNYTPSLSPDPVTVSGTAHADSFVFTGATESITQTPTTWQTGVVYEVGYDVDLYAGGGGTDQFALIVNGTTVSTVAVNTATLGTNSWTEVAVAVKATGTSESVALQLTGNTNASVAVDRAFVVPEPSSAMLLLGGAAGLLGLRRRKG